VLKEPFNTNQPANYTTLPGQSAGYTCCCGYSHLIHSGSFAAAAAAAAAAAIDNAFATHISRRIREDRRIAIS